MSDENKTPVGVVDMTPTWQETVGMCLAILETSKSTEALAVARGELLRIGRLLDVCMHERKE